MIGLDPSRSWRIGDPHVWPSGVVAPTRRTSAWIYEMPPEQSVEMPTLVGRLLDRLAPNRGGLVSLLSRTGAEASVSVAIYMSGVTPDGSLSRAAMSRLVALHADFGVDLYVDGDAGPRNRAERYL